MVIFYGYDPTNGYNPFRAGPVPPVIPTADPTGRTPSCSININGPGSTTAEAYASADGSIPITVTPTAAVPELSSGVTTLFGRWPSRCAIRLRDRRNVAARMAT